MASRKKWVLRRDWKGEGGRDGTLEGERRSSHKRYQEYLAVTSRQLRMQARSDK